MSLPYDYYPAVLYAIGLFSQGYTVTEACAHSNISVQTFRSLIDRDETLKGQYAEAEQRSSDAMVDALINADNHLIHGRTNPQMAKIVSDNIKWVLAKRDPGKFGEKVTVKHDVTVDLAITTALDAARNRVQQIEGADVLDAEIVEDEDALLAELFGS